MTVDELVDAIERSQPIVVDPDGTPRSEREIRRDNEPSGTQVKPQVWAA